MDLERALKDWQAAGLIDAATAEAIRAHETSSRLPWVRWSIIALGLMAVALGLALVVAANWWTIPDALKLGVQMLLTAVAAGAVWHADRRQWEWSREGALFLLGALVLGGIALQTQIFQLSGQSWQALALWLAFMTPTFLLLGRSRLNGYALALMAGWTALALGTGDAGALERGIALAVPAIVTALAAAGQDSFARGLREAGLTLLLLGASVAHVAWSVDLDMGEVASARPALGIGAVLSLVALALPRLRNDPHFRITLACGAAAVAAVLLALGFPHQGDWPSRLAGALVYAAMWGAVGWAAIRHGWTVLFAIAVAALALRLFIIYFEIFASLAMTGAGLIGAGLLLILLVLGGRKLIEGLRPR